MASGDLILSSGTVITAAEIQQIAAEVKKELAAESKELADFEEVSSLTGVSSLPGIQQSGTTMRLVRVAMSVLKGVNGRDIELSASSTAIRWRYVGDEAWNTLVDLSLLKGNKGDPGDPVVLRKGDTGIEWKLQSEPDTAYRTLVAVADLRFSFSDLTDEEKGEITKIPILSEVSATPGTEPSGAFVSEGRDTDGNPVYTLSLVVPRGERGLPPVIEMGTVTTILPDTEASATLVENGETDEGNPKYLLNLNIPAGRPGQDGDGAGNVYINEAEKMESGKLYLFQPGSDGTVNGYFIEFVGQGSVGQKNPDYPGAELFNDYENNVSAGQYAHAEGRETNATGPRAHAEGYKTNVYAADAHAEGRSTWAMGAQSHVEGLYGLGLGAGSHTEGTVEVDFGTGEGSPAILNDADSIRDFWGLFATQYYTNGTDGPYYYKLDWDAIGDYQLHGAFGISAHAEGINNVVCDKAGHVEGANNLCGDMVPGHGKDTTIYAPHMEGMDNKASSLLYAIHVGGRYCVATSGNYTFAHGYYISVSNDYETAFGRYNLSVLNGKKVLFSYGIGSETARKNAFSVLEDGTVVIPVLEAGNLTSESIQRIVDEAVAPISAKVNNNYNELKAIMEEQSAQIAEIIKIIQGGEGLRNAYVLGSMLVITSRLESSVSGETLTITDSDASVTDEVLTIN